MYIGDYLARRELYSPTNWRFIDAGKDPEWRLTYRQANQRANRLANWLQRTGCWPKATGWRSWRGTVWSIWTCSSPAASWALSTPR